MPPPTSHFFAFSDDKHVFFHRPNVSIHGFEEPIVTGTLTSKEGVAIYIYTYIH